MSVKCISVLLLLLQLSCCFSSGSCGKVLVWPMEFSHWMNMKTILDALVQRGHEVTVLRSSASIVISSNNESGIKFETFHTSYSKNEIEDFFMDWFYTIMYNVSLDSNWEHFSVMKMVVLKYSDIYEDICKEVVLNKKLMTKLQESRFDVVLADPVSPGGELLAELLKIPLVYTLRFFPGYILQKHGGGLLLPPSYVPVMMSGLSSQMTFMERVQNLLCMLYFDFWFPKFNEKRWDRFYSEVLGRPATFLELVGKADMWLIRSYWDLEFPRPLLPNFDFIGGLHCKPAKPLPQVSKFLCAVIGLLRIFHGNDSAFFIYNI